MIKSFYIVVSVIFFSCSTAHEDASQEIIDKTIKTAGGNLYEIATIDFDFRDFHYRSKRNGGMYTYFRIKIDSSVHVQDILDNDGFQRLINNKPVEVADSMAVKYSNSINSVIYFALLPYGLNDDSVNKELLGETEISGKDYYKIRVTFDEEGGGEDHEDVFIYWIEKDNYTIDFLAYQFFTEGGGYRFRKAKNSRIINGIRFADYTNFKPIAGKIELEQIDSLYENNGLEQISEINLKNINVTFSGD